MQIYVISLPDSLDRQQFIKSQLDSRRTPFEFIPAVNGRALSEVERNSLYDSSKAKSYKRELTHGEIGCALSHKFVYEKMIKDNVKQAVILEDDITLKPDFFLLLQYLEKLPAAGYTIKLERFNWEKINDDNVKCGRFTPWHKISLNGGGYYIGQPLYNPTLTWGYYIDLAAAKKLYSIMPKVFLASDAWWFYRKFIKLRMISKAVISNNDEIFNSLIGEREYNHNKVKAKNRMLKKVYQQTRNNIKNALKLFFYIFK
ncbi:MAG: glycosyltransferase family 25 protein [Treponema sp.]|nr:glycosyltransferase family 25 protein [Treponema sp.]